MVWLCKVRDFEALLCRVTIAFDTGSTARITTVCQMLHTPS